MEISLADQDRGPESGISRVPWQPRTMEVDAGNDSDCMSEGGHDGQSGQRSEGGQSSQSGQNGHDGQGGQGAGGSQN
eukprot:3550360-Prymnesium_polylepis.1